MQHSTEPEFEGKSLKPEVETVLRNFTRTVLDSLSDHIAVIDETGMIISVNQPWMRFSRDNGNPSSVSIGPGANYLEVCRASCRRDDKTAIAALNGIISVLDHSLEFFTLEYPCHSPEQERWFVMKVRPLSSGSGAVVAHTDITALRKTEESLRASEKRLAYILYAITEWTFDWNVRTGEVYYSPRLI